MTYICHVELKWKLHLYKEKEEKRNGKITEQVTTKIDMLQII